MVLLNGMPGAGKSTLAERYVERHPGVLNLDIDRIRQLIGGDVRETAEPARALALVMATSYLRDGHDVVVPQLVARVDQVERFAAAADAAGVAFVEVLVRAGAVGDERGVGSAQLAAYESGLRDVVARRPNTRILVRREGEVDRTYQDLVDLLADGDRR